MTLAERYRDLARAVERIEGLDIEVRDASLDSDTDEPVADLRIIVPERAMTETPTASMYPAETAEPPDVEPDERGSGDRDVAPDVDEEIVDAVADETGETAPYACDVDGCDYETKSEKGLKIHQTRSHTDQNDELWCGRCGTGPFESKTQLSGHHAGAGHDGDLQAVEEPPDEDGGEPDHKIGDELDEPDTDEASADGGAVAVADRLPDGLTGSDVHDALDELAPKPYLGEVADELGIDRDRLRTVVYELNRYSECVDAATYTGEGRSPV